MEKKKIPLTELPQEVRCPFCRQVIDINLIQRSRRKIDEIEVYFPCSHYWKIVNDGVGYSIVFLWDDDEAVRCERIRSIAEFDDCR